MVKFYGAKKTVVQFVEGLLQSSNVGWQSITITNPARSGEPYVSIVIDMSSEDTVKVLEQIYFKTL